MDSVGTVIIACPTEIPEETEIKSLLMGRATKLESQFRLTYAMILNLLRVEDLKVVFSKKYISLLANAPCFGGGSDFSSGPLM